MTKEELKQEAREWIAKNSKEFITNPNYSPFDYAEAIYLAGAEPREKRIAELEAQIEKMKCCENCRYCNEWGEANSNSPNCKKCNWVSNWKLRR